MYTLTLTLSLDMYTLTGWISVAVGFLSLILFLPGIFQVFVSIQITPFWIMGRASKMIFKEFSVSEVKMSTGDGNKARVAPSTKETKYLY